MVRSAWIIHNSYRATKKNCSAGKSKVLYQILRKTLNSPTMTIYIICVLIKYFFYSNEFWRLSVSCLNSPFMFSLSKYEWIILILYKLYGGFPVVNNQICLHQIVIWQSWYPYWNTSKRKIMTQYKFLFCVILCAKCLDDHYEWTTIRMFSTYLISTIEQMISSQWQKKSCFIQFVQMRFPVATCEIFNKKSDTSLMIRLALK